MKKAKKTIIIILIVLAIIGAGLYFGGNAVVNFVFDKMYNQVITDMIEKEKTEISQQSPDVENYPEDIDTPSDSEPDTTGDISAKQEKEPETSHADAPKKPEKKPEKEMSSTDIAVKKISELTPQELSEIQKLITNEDRAAAIVMVKSALTTEDKKELKAMLKSGKIDFARVRQILSARLSTAQKNKIYGYYEKYSTMYFSMKASGN